MKTQQTEPLGLIGLISCQCLCPNCIAEQRPNLVVLENHTGDGHLFGRDDDDQGDWLIAYLTLPDAESANPGLKCPCCEHKLTPKLIQWGDAKGLVKDEGFLGVSITLGDGSVVADIEAELL